MNKFWQLQVHQLSTGDRCMSLNNYLAKYKILKQQQYEAEWGLILSSRCELNAVWSQQYKLWWQIKPSRGCESFQGVDRRLDRPLHAGFVVVTATRSTNTVLAFFSSRFVKHNRPSSINHFNKSDNDKGIDTLKTQLHFICLVIYLFSYLYLFIYMYLFIFIYTYLY